MKRVKIDKVRFISIFLIFIMIMTAAVGCNSTKKDNKVNKENQDNQQIKPETDLERVILTINDKDYTLQDIMYILYTVEFQTAFDINTSIAMGNSETDYWNEKDDVTGKTIRELTKEQVLDVAEQVIIQEQIAKEKGYQLTEDELDTVESEVQDVLDNLNGNEEYLTRTGFTKEKLTELVKQYDLAYKYFMDQMKKVKVDDASIKKDINPEDYAQVEIEYILFCTGDVDKQGDYSRYEPEMISKILKQAQAAYKEVEEGKDVLEVGDKYYSDEYTVEAGTQPLYKNEEENEESLYNAFKDLKVGELYPGVVETNDGYYIIRLVNDNCTEAYDEIIEEETGYAKEAAYQAEFNKIKANYTIKVNEENWANIQIGNYAVPAVESDFDEEFDYDEDNSEGDGEDAGKDIIDEDGAVG